MAEERTVLFSTAKPADPVAKPADPVVVVLDAMPVEDRPEIQETQDIATIARALVVRSGGDLVAANEYLVKLNRSEKLIHAKVDPLCDRTYAAWKETTTFRASLLDPVVAAKKYISADMFRYKQEQDAIAEQARRVAQAEADRLAKIEADRIQADALARSAAVEAAGDNIAAEQILEAGLVEAQQAIVQATAAVLPRPSTPKLENSGGFRDNWIFTIDKPELVPREYCDPSPTKIRGFVHPRGKEAIGKIPGVTVYNAGRAAAGRK